MMQRLSTTTRRASVPLARRLRSTTLRATASAIPLAAKPRVKAASVLKLPKNSSMRKVYEFARQTQQPISLKNLLDFGADLSEQVLLQSAVWLWNEIPARLARQVVALDRLPYGLCLMPSIREIRENYMRSFDEMTRAREPHDYAECLEFTRVIEAIYARHGGMFAQVAKGIFELQQQMSDNHAREDVEAFVQFAEVTEMLDQFYTTRIGIRMLLGQHVALMRQFENKQAGIESAADANMVGLIDRRCSPANVAYDAIDTALTICRDAKGFAPEITVAGTTGLTFPYVADHLFYMLVELLKNSLRATIEHHGEDAELPDIKVIIAHSDENEDVAIKVSDQGGGIPRSDMPRIWSYLYTTAHIDASKLVDGHLDHAATAPLAGLGYGLPISRMYARYFGGDLQLVSMEGYGSDCYLHLRRLGDIEEPLPA